jgi:hypothetical protein
MGDRFDPITPPFFINSIPADKKGKMQDIKNDLNSLSL